MKSLDFLFLLSYHHILLITCLFLFFLIIDLYFLIPAVIAKNFNPTAELVIPIGIPTKEAKVKIETHPVTAEAKTSKC